MRSRVARIGLVLVLAAAGIAAGFSTWRIEQDAQSLSAVAQHVNAGYARLSTAVADLRVAQGGYVAPGQQDGPWLARVATLVRQISGDITAIRSRTSDPQAALRLGQLSDAVTKLFDTDTHVREYLRTGDDVMAADLIFRDATETAASIAAMLHSLNDDAVTRFDAELKALRQREWTILGATGALWLIGFVLLVKIPRTPLQTAVASGPATASTEAAGDTQADDPARPKVDLASAAAVCTALSRVSDTAALPDLLARAATTVDARGLIVWMAAGDDLYAVAAHGYDPKVIARLGPINRSAENATATAWRLARIKTVAADASANGAIVAPMFGPDDCVGVLAVEVRHGAERDESARAVVTMIAAQLATVIAAWPAASTSAARESVDAKDAVDPALKASGL